MYGGPPLPKAALAILTVCFEVAAGLTNPGVPNPDGYAHVEYEQKISGGSSDGYPDSDEYLQERVLPLTFLGVALSFIFWIYFVCWLIMRCSAGCCGAKCCKSSCCVACCGNDATKEDSTGFCCRSCLLLLLVIGVLLCIPGCAVGYSGTVKVNDGAVDLADWMEDAAVDFVNMAELADAVSRDLGITGGMSTNLVQEAKDVQTAINDVTEYVDAGDGERVRIMQYIFYGMFLAVPLLGVLTYLTGSRMMAHCTICWVFIGLVITWLIFGLLFLTAVVVDDTCYEVSKFVRFEDNNLPQDWCISESVARDTYKELHDEGTRWSTQLNGPGDIISVPFWNPPRTPLSSPSIAYADFVSNRQYRDLARELYAGLTDEFDYTRTRVVGHQACFGLQRSSASQTCQQAYLLASVDGMLASSYVGSCWYITDMATELLDKHCEDTLDGFIELFVAHGLLGCAYIILLAAMLRGATYWTKKSRGSEKVAPAPEALK